MHQCHIGIVDGGSGLTAARDSGLVDYMRVYPQETHSCA